MGGVGTSLGAMHPERVLQMPGWGLGSRRADWTRWQVDDWQHTDAPGHTVAPRLWEAWIWSHCPLYLKPFGGTQCS